MTEVVENRPKVSIVILPFDNPVFFERALLSLKENTDYPNFEIIVSHNPCENEEINNEIERICTGTKINNLKYIQNPTNLYHGPGTMRGVDIADPESKYIVLANDDVFVPGYALNWLSKMVEFAEQDDNIATITPVLFYLKNTVYWCGRNPGKADHLYLHLPKGDPRLPTETFQTESNNMALCLVRRSLLDEFKMDDPGVPPHYGSDSAFYNRVQEKYPESTHWVIPQLQLYHENIYGSRINHKKDKVVEG